MKKDSSKTSISYRKLIIFISNIINKIDLRRLTHTTIKTPNLNELQNICSK
jgi:hypothetical protein